VAITFGEAFRREIERHPTALAGSENRAQSGWVGTNRYDLMKTNEEKFSRRVPPRHIGRMVETVVGCKWSLTVVDLVQRDIRRPGAMERAVEGLTAKVLNDCLRLLVDYGVLEKQSFAEVPPRVEYHFTPFGRKFVETFKILDDLEEELALTKRARKSPAADREACGD
jgi:DNA-binding HxlR family transcriptional regulator